MSPLLQNHSCSQLVMQVNILIGDDGKALLTDFGISRVRNQLTSRSKKQASNDGTLRWMAPERLDGLGLDLPCDVYSFAITAWELYTGDLPFAHIPETLIPR